MPQPDLLLTRPIVLNDDLILRRSSRQDSESLAEFNARIHGENPEDGQRVAQWTRDLLNGRHPCHQPDDFTIVEEVKSKKIVSAMNLISQVWSYAGIPFKVGRPELVGTDPQYRHKGLIRKQFEIVHEWSRLRGEVLQGITGIQNFYRQFGYEMTTELDSLSIGYESTLPPLKEGGQEPFMIRPAQENDLEFITQAYEYSTQRLRLSCVREFAWWRYELTGKQSENVVRLELRMIEDPAGEKIGFFAYSPFLESGYSSIHWFALMPGKDWSAVTPSVLRYIWKTGQEIAGAKNEKCMGYKLSLNSDHPAVWVMRDRLPRRIQYTWYLRVPDLVAFLKVITPALEKHLASSNCAGHTGDLRIGNYSTVLVLSFTQGKITAITSKPQSSWEDCDVAFPMHTFLHVLFGHRSLADIQYMYADCFVGKDKRALVESLFPVQTSHILMIQ